MSDPKPSKPVSDAAEIIERLRMRADRQVFDGTFKTGDARTMQDAADTLERLAKIEQRAKEEFESWGDDEPTFVRNTLHYIWKGSVCIGFGEGDQLQGGSDK